MENWKPIKGFEGLYEVSDEGRVRSLDREVKSCYGSVRTAKGKILSPIKYKSGYLSVHLGKKCMKRINRLVYEAFLGEIPEEMQVNHIDEDKTNNRLDNLSLMTPKENANWGTRNERTAEKLSKPVCGYDSDGNLVVQFPSLQEAGKNGYNPRHISECARGKLKHHKGLRWSYFK